MIDYIKNNDMNHLTPYFFSAITIILTLSYGIKNTIPLRHR